MSLASPLTLTLTQRKVFTGLAPRTARFGVQELVVPSTTGGEAVAAAFIIAPATGIDQERLVRMLDLRVSADVALPINPLSHFKDVSVNTSTIDMALSPVLRVMAPPGEWDETGALPSTVDYPILDVDVPNQRILMQVPFWWSVSGLTWEIRDAALTTVLASGTEGFTQRFNPALTEWRADRFLSAFDDVPAATNQIVATQAYIASLSKQANIDPTSYLAAPPGNPITTVY
jgi:hypothetical protein